MTKCVFYILIVIFNLNCVIDSNQKMNIILPRKVKQFGENNILIEIYHVFIYMHIYIFISNKPEGFLVHLFP